MLQMDAELQVVWTYYAYWIHKCGHLLKYPFCRNVKQSVAYDRSSAPKDCRVSGWLEKHDTPEQQMFLLTEFTYDLEKSNAQTFDVLDSVGSSMVNTIRLDVASNHGSASYTCIYRLRVHGHEPDSLSLPATQS